MANVLGELFSEIANAIREKTGDTATMKPAEFPAKISSITVGGSSEVAVVAEKEYLFAKNNGAYYSMPNIDSNLVAFELVADKEYRVMWDGTSYTCTALRSEDPAGVLIGNPAVLGIPMDTGEPFLVGVMDDGTPAIVTLEGAGDTTMHTVGVYTEGSGGGSCDDVRYVTFMNGDTELYVKPVATGDDCVDVVAKGLIPAPTKASTAQYTYTHNGWSLTAGGAANASALSAVTEDRTVYAAFASSARKYTVKYYDGTTLLQTKSLAYGADASAAYTANKAGYAFSGWSLANDGTVDSGVFTVEGDMTLYAVFSDAGTLDAISWETISADSLAGNASTKYSVGDTKTITLTDTDGTTENVMVAIAGFNLHRNTDGTKDGITFVVKKRAKNKVNGYGSDCSNITSTEKARFPDDLTSVIRSSKIDYVVYNTAQTTDTRNETFFVPELTNISNSLKTPSGSTTIQVRCFNGSWVNVNGTQVANTNDQSQFPLFSGMSNADIAEFFGLASGVEGMTRTLIWGKSGSSSSASRVAIKGDNTYGVCKDKCTSGATYPLICFRV